MPQDEKPISQREVELRFIELEKRLETKFDAVEKASMLFAGTVSDRLKEINQTIDSRFDRMSGQFGEINKTLATIAGEKSRGVEDKGSSRWIIGLVMASVGSLVASMIAVAVALLRTH